MFNWSQLPVTRNEAIQTGDVGCLYSPVMREKKRSALPIRPPVQCSCGAWISSLCPATDTAWQCIICGMSNDWKDAPLAGLNADVDEDDYACITPYRHEREYFTFVIDLTTQDLSSIISSICSTINDTDGAVSIITFGEKCHLWDPTYDTQLQYRESSEFNNKPQCYTTDIDKAIGYLESLTSTYHESSRRLMRCTGLALSLASKIQRGNTILFISGPCTYGPGSVVSMSKKDHIRNFTDMKRGKSLTKFYGKLSLNISVFIGSLDQVGLLEMQSLVNTVIMCDSFASDLFKQSYDAFIHEVSLGKLEVKTSPNLKVRGFLGPGIVSKDNTELSDEPSGKRGNCLSLSMTPYHCIGVVFQCETVAYAHKRHTLPTSAYLQFIVQSKDKIRVTTCRKRAMNKQLGMRLIDGFDQEVWMALMVRSQCFKQLHLKSTAYDQQFRSLFNRFATFIPKEPSTFQLPVPLKHLKQFWFHLHQSPVVQISNKTPDEWAFYALTLMHLGLADSLNVLFPLLVEYSSQGEKEVPLVLESLNDDAVLLMDSFFHLVIQRGENSTPALLGEATAAASQCQVDRLPLPRRVICTEGDSQSRYLRAKIPQGLDYWWIQELRHITASAPPQL